MDTKSLQVALMSIHPRFAEAILSGEKQVEFRRTRFAKDVSHVVIYATKPIGKIIGWFEVAAIKSMHPDALWKTFRDCGGIAEQDFRSYYRGRKTGYAILVRKSKRLSRAKSLSIIKNESRPPQSFVYLNEREFRKITR